MTRHIETTEEYAGQYVAFRSREDDTVIAAGSDPKDVIARAKLLGVPKPVIAHIPQKDSVMVY